MPSRLPSTLPFALLLTASLAAQTNLREFGITLRGRPLGSALPFATLTTLTSPGFGTPAAGQPGHLPFLPVMATTSWPLTPAMEYQIELLADCGCTPDLAPLASLGHRFAIDLSAVFPMSAAVVTTNAVNRHETFAGYLGLPVHFYQGTGPGLPWQDASSGTSNGHHADGVTSVDLVPTAIGGAALTLTQTGEVNAVQSFTGAPPSIGFAGSMGRSVVDFVVTLPMPLALRIAATGEVRGESQTFPLLPVVPPTVLFGNSGRWFDPPLALGYDFQQNGTALFTDILSLPVGIDGDGLFEVWVGGTSLGWFAAGGSVDFQALLGSGVAAFRITGIDPAVDATDSAVFPVQLAFDTPTAEFTMTPVLWRKVGSSCSDPVCAPCTAIELAPNGPAIEGDLGFGFDLTNGPTGGAAAVFLGFGTTNPAPIPFLCGDVVLPPLNGIFHVGTTALTGSASCDGAGFVSLPLVPTPPLVGLFLTVQAVTLCPAGGLGLTHGVEFAIGD